MGRVPAIRTAVDDGAMTLEDIDAIKDHCSPADKEEMADEIVRLSKENDALRAEVERLREMNGNQHRRIAELENDMADYLREDGAAMKALRAEVERLSAELNHEQMDSLTGREMVTALRAEVERLQERFHSAVVASDSYRRRAAELEKEKADIAVITATELFTQTEARIAELESLLDAAWECLCQREGSEHESKIVRAIRAAFAKEKE
jgi:chromosome segregation ATPase